MKNDEMNNFNNTPAGFNPAPIKNANVYTDVPNINKVEQQPENKPAAIDVAEVPVNKKIAEINKPIEAPEGKKYKFKYEVKNSQGEKVKGYFDAYKQSDVETYLQHEGYEIIKIALSKDIILSTSKLRYADLAFLLTQLSTYLKAGISLIDAVRILEKQATNANQRNVFSNLTYELVKGESFSNALESQGNTFPKLLINMVKTAEMTGDLPSTLDDMTVYYTDIDRTRKQVVSAMTYPIIIFIFAIMVITFILLYIIPTFVELFEQNNAEIPTLTKVVLNISSFLTNNGIWLVVGILIFALIYTIMFKKIKPFRKAMQSFFMKLPIIGKMMIYKEVSMFTKTFASLLNHNVFITDSMAILSQVTSNEVYSKIINKSLDYLAKGAKISDSFKGEWAFPVVAYEMLVTGENTGRLPTMMQYVADYYSDLHSNMTKRLNTFIEPIMIVLLAVLVGIVLLAVIIPMFSFYSQIQ